MRHKTPDLSLTRSDAPSAWVRLRTLILLRWTAICGQIAAIATASLVFRIDLNLGLCLLTISVAVIANIVSISIFPETKRLSETGTMFALLFDITQLAMLLFLTGGLNNPFALLMLAPVTISATALRSRSTIFLGTVTIAFTSLLAVAHMPLLDAGGRALRMPDLFLFGFWLAMVIGVVFLGLYAWRVATEIHSMGEALLATQLALSREQKLTDLGGVVAAAAHELGTPLATIKLVSSELADELEDRPDLREDVELIRSQAERCRDILHSMGRAGKDDRHLHLAPVQAVLEEAAEPHAARGKKVHLSIRPDSGGAARQPVIRRRPELIHGLRNLVQNAVDFAGANVWVDARWTGERLTIRVSDDGPGFPAQILGRIGDPFVRRRDESEAVARPGYQGMGLGLFIAKTLLERTGAEVSFANGSDPFLTADERPERCGAVIELVWPLDQIEEESPGGLGANTPFPE